MHIVLEGDLGCRFINLMASEGTSSPVILIDRLMDLAEGLNDGSLKLMDKERSEYLRKFV